MRFGIENALRKIFSYRAIADLPFDLSGSHFPKWPTEYTVLAFSPLLKFDNQRLPICIHVRSLVSLLSPGEICHGGTEPNVGILSTEPFLVGVYDGTNHGLIKCTRVCGITRYRCSTCLSSIPNCNHLEVFKECEAEDSILEPEQASMNEASKFPSAQNPILPTRAPSQAS